MRRAEEQVSGDGSGTQVSDSGMVVGLGADKTWGTVVALGNRWDMGDSGGTWRAGSGDGGGTWVTESLPQGSS